MSFFDGMTMSSVLKLYYEKHEAIREGNMEKLLELKNECPELFEKEKDDEIRFMIEYAKNFKASERYKELLLAEKKKIFSVVDNKVSEE